MMETTRQAFRDLPAARLAGCEPSGQTTTLGSKSLLEAQIQTKKEGDMRMRPGAHQTEGGQSRTILAALKGGGGSRCPFSKARGF